MTHILQLNSSLSGESGQSSRLASGFAGALAAATGGTLTVRDLASQPLPHLTAERFAAFTTELAPCGPTTTMRSPGLAPASRSRAP